MLKYLPLLFLILPNAALASESADAPIRSELAIVAIVNDEVITSMDVADRVAFVVATTKLPKTQETMQRLIPQVTRQLIDEKLQLQEANRLGLSIAGQEISQAAQMIAGRQGVAKELLYANITSQGVPKEAFDEQIKAQIAWQKVVARKVRPSVKISDTEVERARLSESLKLTAQGAIEVNVINFTLPVSKPEEEAEVKALAEKLVADLKKGANFEELAAQFGSTTTPKAIWTPLSQLEPSIAAALSKGVPGAVSNPARTLDGYVIIKLLGRRGIASAEANDSKLLIKDILLALNMEDEPEAAELSLTIAREVARNPGTCESGDVAGIDALNDLEMRVQFIEAQFSELSQAIQKMVANLSVGAVSEPFAGPDGIHLLMLCERTDNPPKMATAEATYSQLMNKKFELETQKYMRNLRRDAFIEFRR